MDWGWLREEVLCNHLQDKGPLFQGIYDIGEQNADSQPQGEVLCADCHIMSYSLGREELELKRRDGARLLLGHHGMVL